MVLTLLTNDKLLTLLVLLLLPHIFSERELMFMFAIGRRPSVCRLSVCRLSSVVCRLSVTFVHPTQPIEIFDNVSAPFNTLVT